jgi:hypothetical protein
MLKASLSPEIPNLHRKRALRKDWITRFLQHGPYCHYCNTRLTIDTAVKEHLTPLCRGGSDTMDNMAPACTACNEMKAWRTEEEFIRDRPMLFARRTASRSMALPTEPITSMEEAIEPGLLKKLVNERENRRHWWKSPYQKVGLTP